MLLADVARLAAQGRAVESMLFEHLGRWTASAAEPGVAAELAEWSAHHAWHVELWTERFPAIPVHDLDAATHVAAADAADDATRLSSAASTRDRVGAAADVLARFEASCSAARRDVTEAVDAPTARVLDLVLADLRTDLARADAVLASLGA